MQHRMRPRFRYGIYLAVWALSFGWSGVGAQRGWAQDIDAIIQRHLEVMGGVERLQSVQSMHMKGTMLFQGVEAPVEFWFQRPNRVRIETTFQGQKFVQAYDGETAWWIMPFMGDPTPKPMPEAQAKRFIENSQDFLSPFIDYKEKGYTVELVGEEEIEGTPVYHIRLKKRSERVIEYFLDKETAVLLRTRAEIQRENQTIQSETVFGDYQQVEGIAIPFSIQSYVNGQLMSQMTVQQVEINPEIDPALFHMPKTEKTTEQPLQRH